MLKWKKLLRLPVCYSLVFGGVGTSDSARPYEMSNLVLRFENARVINSGSCSFNNRTDGINTACSRTASGVTKLTFSFPWSSIPNCTATSESMTYPIISLVPTINDVTITTASFSTVLGLISLGNGDTNYAIRCSAGQNVVN